MAEAIKRIPLSPESELARELDAAKSAARPVAVDTGDTVYELFVSRTRPATPSEQSIARSINGIKAAAGSWKDIDVAAFDAYREERRKIHTRPALDP